MAGACGCAAAAATSSTGETMARLQERYRRDLVAQLRKDLGLRNVYQVPRVEKVVINMGLGEAIQNAKALDAGVAELSAIAGQKAIVTTARKAIANFKLREGMSIGCRVTLRGRRMYEFLDRLLSLALPRVRDFRGVSDRSFDGRGNYSLGIREQIIFPEINLDRIDKVRGLSVSIVTSAKTDAAGKALLQSLGMPFRV